MTVASEIYWDPYDIDIDTDPYALWRRMRDEAPLYRNDTHGFWALSRFEDVHAASRDLATFSSARGTVLELMNATGGADLSALNMMIFMDPPGHTSLRTLVSKAFTRNRIAQLEEQVREVCREYLDPRVGTAGFDYLDDFGAHLPSRMISGLMGVPLDERPRVLEIINTMFHIEPGVGMLNPTAIQAQMELGTYLGGLIERVRDRPSDDLLSALLAAEMRDGDGLRKLTDEEVIAFATLLVSAGTETVARLLGWTAVVLAENPDQRRALAEDPSRIPNAVEELLRFEAPSPVQGRWTTRDVELYGETVPEGSKVVLLTGSAGRDERRFPDPDRFDIGRKIDQHLSFGIGAHFCLGAALARLEGRVALEETLARFPEWTVDTPRAERLHTSTVRGYKRVPILL